jgi:hypothetical protein
MENSLVIMMEFGSPLHPFLSLRIWDHLCSMRWLCEIKILIRYWWDILLCISKCQGPLQQSIHVAINQFVSKCMPDENPDRWRPNFRFVARAGYAKSASQDTNLTKTYRRPDMVSNTKRRKSTEIISELLHYCQCIRHLSTALSLLATLLHERAENWAHLSVGTMSSWLGGDLAWNIESWANGQHSCIDQKYVRILLVISDRQSQKPDRGENMLRWGHVNLWEYIQLSNMSAERWKNIEQTKAWVDTTWTTRNEFFTLRLFQTQHLFGLVLTTLSCQDTDLQFAVAADSVNSRWKSLSIWRY